MAASLATGFLVLLTLMISVPHPAPEPGVGHVTGGILPCVVLMLAVFIAVFVLVWRRIGHTESRRMDRNRG
jgi:hypothetical protein